MGFYGIEAYGIKRSVLEESSKIIKDVKESFINLLHAARSPISIGALKERAIYDGACQKNFDVSTVVNELIRENKVDIEVSDNGSFTLRISRKHLGKK